MNSCRLLALTLFLGSIATGSAQVMVGLDAQSSIAAHEDFSAVPSPWPDRKRVDGALRDFASIEIYPPLASSPPELIVLDTFDSGGATGSVRAGTTWVGNVIANPGSIRIGATAMDDNGWGATQQSINATGMNFILVTGQREAGNLAPSLLIQFEDASLRTQVYSISTTAFAFGQSTQVPVDIGSWPAEFDFTRITGWSLGGGSVGVIPFSMTFEELSLSSAAIPEPATYALLLGLTAISLAARRRLTLWLGRRRL